MIAVGVAAGGAVGALARYVVDIAVAGRLGRRFPWGTLLINVTGSFLLGYLTGLALDHVLSRAPSAILGAGFCGGYTTFSTHAVDTVALADERGRGVAVANVLGTVVLATAAAAAGLALAPP